MPMKKKYGIFVALLQLAGISFIDMKRFCLILIAFVAYFNASAQVNVPDASGVYESTRVYDVVTDTDSCYYFTTPKPCIKPVQQGWLAGYSRLVQQYVTNDTLTIYGVAFTVYNDNQGHNPYHANQTHFRAIVNSLREHTSNPAYYLYDYIMDTEDTVTMNRAHPRFCWFQYKDGCNVEKSMTVPCYELYFDTPDHINLMTDTFYVGYEWSVEQSFCPQLYGGEFDNSLPGTLYGAFTQMVGDSAYRNFNYYDQKLWGVAFPIVGFRCGPMEEYWVDSLAADSAVVRWRRVEQGTKFNVRLVGSDGSDTTYVTADTALALGGLSDTVLYNVMLRKQCRYATTNYDTTVYGAWLSTLTFGRDPDGDTTAGIGAAQIPTFDLVPNPARETVSVVLSGTKRSGRLSVLDMAGRELVSRRVEGPVAVLDVSALPAGVYLVRLATDTDVSTRRLSLLD